MAVGVVVGALVASACGGSDDGAAEEPASPTSGPTTDVPGAPSDAAEEEAWAEVDAALAALGPEVGLLVARVADDGTCETVHDRAPSTARPMASQFKLLVLGALAEQVADGTLAWDRTLTVEEADRSLGNGEGSLQMVPPGTTVTVEEAATKMISISDNTATDLLIELVGRDAVEAQAAEWVDDDAANVPFLTTRQMFLLHYASGLGDRYLATPPEERAAFLVDEVDPLPISEIGTGYTTEPRFVDTIEWFASPADVCRALAGLHALSDEPSLATALPSVLSQEDAGIDLDASAWPTVWYKGGSEPGVLTMGWLATTAEGETFVVEAMVSDPDAALAEASLTDLVDVGRDAFALLA
jgi:hypothetical protein